MRSGKDSALLMDALSWLVLQQMPDLVMEIVREMKTIDFDWLASTFKSYPQLLLACLEERADDEQSVREF